MFAGPNGSGKTTLVSAIKDRFDLGYFINADEIENTLKTEGFIDLNSFSLKSLSSDLFSGFVKDHPLVDKALDVGLDFRLSFKKGTIQHTGEYVHSYEAALIADFVRQRLLVSGKKFAFETVMSHQSKLELLKSSREKGYKNYLYFISTESPLINIERVRSRVKLGGHDVSKDRIEDRYFRSMNLLKDAIPLTFRTFIFDNSGKEKEWILEIENGTKVTFKHTLVPEWIDKYVPFEEKSH